MKWVIIALTLCLWSYRISTMSGAVSSALRTNSRQKSAERLLEESSSQYCLAETIYYEARNQPLRGQLAVAYVVFNRSRESGKSICGVVNEKIGGKCQFPWRCSPRLISKRKELGSWLECQEVAAQIMSTPEDTEEDPTFGAVAFRRYDAHFDRLYNSRLKKTVTIGPHVFFAEK